MCILGEFTSEIMWKLHHFHFNFHPSFDQSKLLSLFVFNVTAHIVYVIVPHFRVQLPTVKQHMCHWNAAALLPCHVEI